jgi:hypothetical protein
MKQESSLPRSQERVIEVLIVNAARIDCGHRGIAPPETVKI